MMANLSPIFSENLFANRVSSNTVWAESLHAKIVNETLINSWFHLCLNLSIRDVFWNEPQSNWESISSQLTQIERMVDALKTANFDFVIPIFAAHLPDHMLT